MNAFSSPNIPPEILATLLNLVRFLEPDLTCLSNFLQHGKILGVLGIVFISDEHVLLPLCSHEMQ